MIGYSQAFNGLYGPKPIEGKNTMNQRIKELAGETLDHAMPQTWCSVSPDELDRILEKFAELIVRECVKLQYKNVVVGGVSDYNRGRRELAEEISKHFGVEE